MKFKKGDKVQVIKPDNPIDYVKGDIGTIVDFGKQSLYVLFDHFTDNKPVCVFENEIQYTHGYQSPLWKVLNGESI